jgi:excisionase family DNA binding protein
MEGASLPDRVAGEFLPKARVMKTEAIFLTTDEVAERERLSKRALAAMVAERSIPHQRWPGRRHCLFRIDWLEAWEADPSIELETVPLPGDGRIVWPRDSA